MKYLIVGIFLLLIFALALHYGVIKINFNKLHKCKWQIVKWVAGILGAFIINSLLR